MLVTTDSAEGLRTQVAEIGPREYVVTAWAEGDVDDLDDFEAVLEDVLEREPTAVLVDLRALTFFGPTTFEAVASSLRRLREAGIFVVLVTDWRELSRVVGAEGLDRFIAVRSSLASAIEAVRGRSA
jgi:anti-anti-sigma factor